MLNLSDKSTLIRVCTRMHRYITICVLCIYFIYFYIFTYTRDGFFPPVCRVNGWCSEKVYATASIGKLFKANNAQGLEIIRARLMAPQRPVLNHDTRLLYDVGLSMKFTVYVAAKKCIKLL